MCAHIWPVNAQQAHRFSFPWNRVQPTNSSVFDCLDTKAINSLTMHIEPISLGHEFRGNIPRNANALIGKLAMECTGTSSSSASASLIKIWRIRRESMARFQSTPEKNSFVQRLTGSKVQLTIIFQSLIMLYRWNWARCPRCALEFRIQLVASLCIHRLDYIVGPYGHVEVNCSRRRSPFLSYEVRTTTVEQISIARRNRNVFRMVRVTLTANTRCRMEIEK